MKIKHGTSRCVILLPCFGLAVKLPKIDLGTFWHVLLRSLKQGHGREFTVILNPRRRVFVLRGLACNFAEFWFYMRTRNTFAWPTYFSLFGLCNIQKLATVIHYDEVFDVFHAIENIAGADFRDRHCFAAHSNYCRRGGKLYLLDYGSANNRLVLQKYERQLRTQL